MFVTTANTLNMAPPLLDRMEIIRISGYTEDEKVEIAKRHLIDKQMKTHGLKKGEWSISEAALRDIVRYYTREAGVRNLEREIASLTRKTIKEILMENVEGLHITRRNLAKYAGVRRFRYGEVELEDLVGVSTGLAWTEVGGELLSVEALIVPGKGKMTITGKLGDVMKESIQAAKSYVQSRAAQFGIKPTVFVKKDIHVHVPEGATPKDGPSAGVADGDLDRFRAQRHRRAQGRRDDRGDHAARPRAPHRRPQGEVAGRPAGGLRSVLIPRDNEKDLAEIPDNVKRGLEIVSVGTVDEVLQNALVSRLTPIEWDEDVDAGTLVQASSDDDDVSDVGDVGDVITH